MSDLLCYLLLWLFLVGVMIMALTPMVPYASVFWNGSTASPPGLEVCLDLG